MYKDLSDKNLIVNAIPPANENTISVSCKEILDNPVCELSTIKLYSYEQMLRMFANGSVYMVNETNRIAAEYESIRKRPFGILKSMKIGDVKKFHMNKWNAVRTAASVLKRDYGCVFAVHKSKISDTKFNIVVERKL